MRDLDETDMTILRILSADARASYSEIGEEVDLSAPAVSDRVSRLEEAGVIRGFTLDLDRSQLQGGVPLLVTVDVDPGHTSAVRAAVDDIEAAEHVFQTADGDVVFHARLSESEVEEVLAGVAGAGGVADFDVTMLTDVDWTPTVSGSGFALECAECGNTVGSEGQASKIGDSVYHFCCLTCKGRFEQRHERLESGA
ncbi:AsnC family transcriptional regulator [Halolamina litorea]|uniref:Winged helix-turn-helix transcriptional regulator n=1 Tax=Halolamina litorea TaxID=1515593 RepID=A0ABD6BRT3_9EURY|nr:AsnC family transcriptional regulator [Halolamina litorea]